MNNIRFQLKNIETQFENMIILIQNNSLQNPKTQLQNMGIQMINMGIQMLNNGLQIPSMEMNDIIIKQEIQNIGIQIKNIEMQMNNNFSMQIKNNNFGMNMNDNKFIDSKIDVNFIASSGLKVFMSLDKETTVGEMLTKYLKEINYSDPLNKNGYFAFLFNGCVLNFEDKTKIDKLFKGINNVTVTVIDKNNVIGG